MASQQLPPHSENVDEELHRIRLALQAVFSCPPSHPQQADHHVAAGATSSITHQQQQEQWWDQRQLADRYLTSFQTASPVAWMVCDRLLQEDSGSEANAASEAAIHFFAAQTLHTKCCADVDELPASSLPSLRDSLLQHLKRHNSRQQNASSTADNALTIRLAMCVSALAVHMGWTTVIADFMANIKSESNHPTAIRMALSILQTLPEECASERLLLLPENEQNRFLMRDHLISSAPNVFAFLFEMYLNNQNQKDTKESTLAVFRTFHLWIRYVPIQASALRESPLLTQAVLPAMAHLDSIDDDILELAADVLVEVLRMYPSHCPTNEALVQQLIPALAQLPLQQALQLSHPNTLVRQQSDDIWRAYCRVVTEMGESYLGWILGYHDNRDDGPQRLVDWMLQCSQIPDTEIASMTLHFWNRFVADLEAMEPMEWRQDLVDIYTPQLLQLMRICVAHLLRFQDGSLAEDDAEDWLQHRSYVEETIQDGCRLLGGQCVLYTLGQLLKEQMHSIQNNSSPDWTGLEACLAGVCALHKFVPNDESDILPLCFQILIPQLPPDQGRLRHTAIQVIGKFAPWLAAHPDLVPPLLPFLAQGLYEDCASASAIAIKELCECSDAQTFNLVQPVLQLYEETMGRLDLSNELQLLEGVCRALSRTLLQDNDSDFGAQALTRLARPLLNRLAATVNNTTTPPRSIIAELDRLTVIVRFLTLPWSPSLHQHPMMDLSRSFSPLLEAATNHFPNDNLLAENICRLHKHTLRVCGARTYAPMLEDLLQQLVHSFEVTHQSPYLYAASICVAEYGADPMYAQRLFDAVAMMVHIVFSFLRTLEDFTNHPDVVEEFFYLLARMVTHCPSVVTAQAPLLHSLVHFAVVGLQLQHVGANKGTLQFLDKILSHGFKMREDDINHINKRAFAPLEQVLTQDGPGLVSQLVHAVVGDLPSGSQVPEILWKLNLLCPVQLMQWLASALATASLPEHAKTEFLNALDTTKERDDFRLVVGALQGACNRERRRRLRTATRRA